MTSVQPNSVHNPLHPRLSRSERMAVRTKEILALHKQGLSMNQITQFGYSKLTVFKAIHQRSAEDKKNKKNAYGKV